MRVRDRTLPGARATGRPDPPGARLRRKIDLLGPALARACGEVFGHPRIREVLPEYLVRTHTIIRTTVPLMETAIARSADLGRTDPVAAGVRAYLERHIEEERDHDDWLLKDLALMGLDPGGVLARIPSPTVAALTGTQYYWVLHAHPVALLGYFAFMEGFPPSARLIEELIAHTGFPREAFRTLAEHGDLDQGHREELDRTIDALPVTPEQQTLLGLSAITTAELLVRSIDEVLEGFETR